MLDDDGNVIAVLDWEICTLGDPLADVGLLMVYWTEADDAAPMLLTAPTAVDGFLARKPSCSTATPTAADRDLSQIDFYIAFGYWKLACIVEGVYARYVGGAMGSTTRRRSRASRSRSSAAPRRPPRRWAGSDEAAPR